LLYSYALLMFDTVDGSNVLANRDDKRPERERRNSGQVQHDDRGNAVWQWATDTARTAMASTSQLLRKLDLTGLSLESDGTEEAAHPDSAPAKPVSSSSAAAAKSSKKSSIDSRRAGFDPYSTNAGTAKRAPPLTAAKAATKTAGVKPAPAAAAKASPPAAAPARRPSWWQRLLSRG
jgi:hypothetical protein